MSREKQTEIINALVCELECNCPILSELHSTALDKLSVAEAATETIEEVIVSIMVIAHRIGLYDNLGEVWL